MLSDLLENVLRVLQQGAFEERERARVLQRNDDRHVLFLVGEAGLAPFQLLGQVAVECNLPQVVYFLLPLFRVRRLHRPTRFHSHSCSFTSSLSNRALWRVKGSRDAPVMSTSCKRYVSG